MAYKIKKLTKKKVNYFIKDEKKASKEYHKYGFHSIAKDESRHEKYFENIKKERY
jgi:hypothetical protein